jgi:lipopolysaccharide export LptBFGC system permease protein LptF
VQTFLRPDRKWVFGLPGEPNRIFYFKYLDAAQHVMIGPNVYELDPQTFRLRRHITADSARWNPAQRQWVFQNAWAWEFEGYRPIRSYRAAAFPEITETPAYFLTEKKQEQQLNFLELETRIAELQQSGLDTVRMRVQYYRKFSVPLFAGIMALLAVPFSFQMGNRGAMAGIGVALGIAIAYMAIGRLFSEIGNVNQLPAEVAAWAPDALFTTAGLYWFARMRS